ncbi:MAG: hypothetical protein N2557_08070 [Hydrogenophilus sp.]|nr:hypothetical protein [Hydrogenophilus sp.]
MAEIPHARRYQQYQQWRPRPGGGYAPRRPRPAGAEGWGQRLPPVGRGRLSLLGSVLLGLGGLVLTMVYPSASLQFWLGATALWGSGALFMYGRRPWWDHRY